MLAVEWFALELTDEDAPAWVDELEMRLCVGEGEREGWMEENAFGLGGQLRLLHVSNDF